jgi:cytochrome P450
MAVAPPAVADFDPRSREYLLDPQAAVQHLYDEAPVFYHEPENAWFVLRYDDVRRVMDDYQTYSNECYKTMPVPPHLRELIPAAWEHAGQTIQGRQLNNMDPPAHTVERRAEQRTFTHKRVNAIKPDIAAIANELIDDLEGRGGCDLMQEYSVQLTLRVIGTMLDLPREMLPGFLDFIGDVVGLLAPIDMTADRVTMPDDQLVGRYERVHAAFVLYSEFLDERRANPGDDLTSAMLALTDDDGEPLLTSDQVLGHMLGLVAAGGDTTALLITNMVRSFTESPDQLRLVLDDPRLWDNAVWEGLRRSGIVTQMLRLTREDAEIAGVTIPAGSTVAPSLVSANSDPSRFPDPLRFDVARANAGDSLTFGHGRHYCLGAPLAIPEARIGLETLYARLPTLQADLDFELEFKPSLNMRMYGSQRVGW